MGERMSNDTTDHDATRRRVLRALGTAGVAGIGVGSTGTASAQVAAAKRREAAYASPGAAREAVADHATPLLSALVDRGVLDRGEVAELGLDSLEPAWEYERFGGGATVTAFEAGGTLSAKISVSSTADGDAVEVVVQPERGGSLAHVDPADGEPFTLRQEPDGTLSTGTRDCGYEYFCRDDHCESSIYTYYRQYCCNEDGVSWCEYAEKIGCC
jgi:hypothetical protein